MPNPILEITDGTITIDMLRPGGFRLRDWIPMRPELKGGGVWRGSPLSDGHQLVAAQYHNVIDTFSLICEQSSQDTLIRERQELDRLLIKAREYWTTDWQNEPVWIVAKGPDESETRYAVIHSYAMPMDDNPYGQPFYALGGECPVQEDLTLMLEHGFWQAEEIGIVTAVEASANDGTQGQEATTDRDCYVANKHNVAQITDVYTWQTAAGPFSANLIGGALPQYLFARGALGPATGDITYFGIDSTVANSGPFCSLVFDISVAAVYAGAIGVDYVTWQYYTGIGWFNLTVWDNTDATPRVGPTTQAWSRTGVNSIHWDQPTPWVPVAINGITAFWVRAVVTEGNSIGPAIQQNRDIYTITWANVDISPTTVAGDEQIYGDVPLLARWILEAVAESTTPNMWEQNFWLALRTKERGPLFQAYVNFADEQNPAGITITALGISAFANDTTSVTGRIIQYSAAGISALANQARATFLGATIATDYIGRYRAFVRYRVSAGNDGDMRMTLTATTAGRSIVSDSIPLLNLGLWTVADCGSFDIPVGQVPGATDQLDSFSFSVQVENTVAAARVADLMDLILLPSDEWLGYFSRDLSGDYFVAGDELHIDSATQPKHQLIAFEYWKTSPLIQYQYVRYAAGPTILQSNPSASGLQMWFFMGGEDSAMATTEPIFSPTYAVRVEAAAAHRYLSMRGNR